MFHVFHNDRPPVHYRLLDRVMPETPEFAPAAATVALQIRIDVLPCKQPADLPGSRLSQARDLEHSGHI